MPSSKHPAFFVCPKWKQEWQFSLSLYCLRIYIQRKEWNRRNRDNTTTIAGCLRLLAIVLQAAWKWNYIGAINHSTYSCYCYYMFSMLSVDNFSMTFFIEFKLIFPTTFLSPKLRLLFVMFYSIFVIVIKMLSNKFVNWEHAKTHKVHVCLEQNKFFKKSSIFLDRQY